MGDGCLNNEHFEELGGILKGKLEEHFKNQELRQSETSFQPYFIRFTFGNQTVYLSQIKESACFCIVLTEHFALHSQETG